MRKGLLLALLLGPLACAHQPRDTNLAKRPSVETPRGDFKGNTGHATPLSPSAPEPVPPAPIP